jgi:hypothetical protein
MGKSLTVGDSNANACIAHPLCGPHVSLHGNQKNMALTIWLVVSPPLKNISQLG